MDTKQRIDSLERTTRGQAKRLQALERGPGSEFTDWTPEALLTEYRSLCDQLRQAGRDVTARRWAATRARASLVWSELGRRGLGSQALDIQEDVRRNGGTPQVIWRK